MRNTTLVLNSIVVVFFACFLAYTIVARQHLEVLAREFVTEKTLAYSRPTVEIADEAVDSLLVKSLLTDAQTDAIRKEIAEYRVNPVAYVADLTRQNVPFVPMDNANRLVEKVALFKNKIRTFYASTLNALIFDLRIFSLCNLLASLVALVLAWRSSAQIRKPIVWFSFLTFVAVLYCSYMYVDGLSFFRILFRAHLGWWYAVFLCVVTAALYLGSGRNGNATKQTNASVDKLNRK